jgi:hypothetical protein
MPNRGDKEDPNADPETVAIEVRITKAPKNYYRFCGKIDQHNRNWQDSFGNKKP